jgi:hypothetical protein
LSSVLPAIVAALVFVYSLRRWPILHPTQVWAGSWLLGTGLYALRLLPYRDLSWLTAGLICGVVVTFALAAPLGARLARRAHLGSDTYLGAQTVQRAALLALGLLAVSLAAFLAHLVAKFGIAHVIRISTEVKVYLSSNEAPLSTTYVDVAVVAATLTALAASRTKHQAARRLWLCAAAAASASVYFSTSRAFIAVGLTAALGAYVFGRENTRPRAVLGLAAFAVVATVALFVGLGAVIGKTYGNSTIGQFDNFFSRHPALRSLALPYEDTTASIPALDLLVKTTPTWGIAHGCATAPIACGALRKAGLPTLLVPVTGPFTRQPLQWNAYTFLDRFLIDGGVAITILLTALTGAIAGYFWQRARERSTLGIVLYAMSLPALVGAYRNNLIELVFVSVTITLLLLAAAQLTPRLGARLRLLASNQVR